MVGSLEPRGDTAVALLLFFILFSTSLQLQKKKSAVSEFVFSVHEEKGEEKEKKVAEKEILKGLKGV